MILVICVNATFFLFQYILYFWLCVKVTHMKTHTPKTHTHTHNLWISFSVFVHFFCFCKVTQMEIQQQLNRLTYQGSMTCLPRMFSDRSEQQTQRACLLLKHVPQMRTWSWSSLRGRTLQIRSSKNNASDGPEKNIWIDLDTLMWHKYFE